MENDKQVVSPEQDDVVIVDQYDSEGLKKNLQTTLEQKKHWRNQAIDPSTGKKYKELFEEMKAKAQVQKVEPNEQLIKKEEPSKPEFNFDSLVDNIDVIRDIKSDELAELRTVSRELGVDPVKYIKSKAGQAHLKEIRSVNQGKEGTPGPSSRIPVFNGKPVKDIFADDKASSSDKQSAFEALKKKKGLNQNQ